MRIADGTPEDHPTPFPLDSSATPAVVSATPRFPSGNQQGGVLSDISGVDFTADAAAAMASGMSADSDRRGRYAAGMSPLGASYGDAMTLPPGGMDPGAASGEALPAGSFYTPPRSGAPADTA